jgi:hypothetical protein
MLFDAMIRCRSGNCSKVPVQFTRASVASVRPQPGHGQRHPRETFVATRIIRTSLPISAIC